MIVGEYTNIRMSLRVSSTVPSNGIIFIIFPKWDDPNLGAENPASKIDRFSSCSAHRDISGSNPHCTNEIGP